MRLQRWMLIIQGYDLTIEYREHDANANADGLSRTPLPKEAIQLLTPIIREDLNEWKAAQAADLFCIQVLQSINEDKNGKQSVQFLQLPNGILTMTNGAIIVPSTLRNKILLNIITTERPEVTRGSRKQQRELKLASAGHACKPTSVST